MKIGVVGTAGRDSRVLTIEHLRSARRRTIAFLRERDATCLVSGGSAWMDHVAVQLFDRGYVEPLVLCLPARLLPDGRFENSPDGRRLNDLHQKCQEITGYPVFEELARIRELPSLTVYHDPGFAARNRRIARMSDHLLAFTFGVDEPDTAGSRYTWRQVSKENRTHFQLK